MNQSNPSHVLVQTDGPITKISLNRPDVLNAMDASLTYLRQLRPRPSSSYHSHRLDNSFSTMRTQSGFRVMFIRFLVGNPEASATPVFEIRTETTSCRKLTISPRSRR